MGYGWDLILQLILLNDGRHEIEFRIQVLTMTPIGYQFIDIGELISKLEHAIIHGRNWLTLWTLSVHDGFRQLLDPRIQVWKFGDLRVHIFLHLINEF